MRPTCKQASFLMEARHPQYGYTVNHYASFAWNESIHWLLTPAREDQFETIERNTSNYGNDSHGVLHSILNIVDG